MISLEEELPLHGRSSTWVSVALQLQDGELVAMAGLPEPAAVNGCGSRASQRRKRASITCSSPW